MAKKVSEYSGSSKQGVRRNTQAPPRSLMADVPYIGFDTQRTGGRFEDTPACAAMRAALQYLGDPLPYEYLMGVSGASFRLAWNAEWLDGGNLSTLHIGSDPTEHIRRMFHAAGWEPRFIGNSTWREENKSNPGPKVATAQDILGTNIDYQDEAVFRQWIIEDLHFKSRPMLAIGVLAPGECGLLAGYDESGDVLIGWMHFQDWPENKESEKVSYEPEGFFRKRDWFRNTVGFVSFHTRIEKPSEEESYREAVEWALKLGRTERFGRYYSGLAGYGAWASMLKGDQAFAAADARALGWLLMCHNDTLGATWEGRIYAQQFLRSGAALLPKWSKAYEEAAGTYAAEVKCFEKIADALGGEGESPEKARLLAKPENRAAILPLIQQARDLDAKALSLLESTLA